MVPCNVLDMDAAIGWAKTSAFDARISFEPVINADDMVAGVGEAMEAGGHVRVAAGARCWRPLMSWAKTSLSLRRASQ